MFILCSLNVRQELNIIRLRNLNGFYLSQCRTKNIVDPIFMYRVFWCTGGKVEEHGMYFGKIEFYQIIRNIGGTWNDSKESLLYV